MEGGRAVGEALSRALAAYNPEHPERILPQLAEARELARKLASSERTEEKLGEIDRLLAHWCATVPLPILEVQYEDLVANLETESRRLIAFLGLEWDPACLAFHETERPVMTASVWQVRQPLYSSSAGRWRHYRKHLGPLLRDKV